MKTIATLLTALVLQACDVTEVPEEHRATADSLIRADSIRRADSLAALPAVQIHSWSICLAGEDKLSAMEWEDPRFWGQLRLRLAGDTLRTPEMHSGECWSLGALPDTAHVQILMTSTATRFDSVWVVRDSMPTRSFLPWHAVQLHPDSLRRISDSVATYGVRGLFRRVTR